MEKLARKLADRISDKLLYDVDKKEVIEYGLIAIIQIIITTLLVFIVGIITGSPIEALIICFSVSLLRKYSGGAHMHTIEMCTSFAVIYCTIFSVLSKYLIYPVIDIYFLICASVIVYGISFWAVCKLAPVDSPNKPIKTEKKKKRMRKGSLITLFAYCCFSVILFTFGFVYRFLLSYQISLLFGILWQTFTLTKVGSYFLGGIDLIAKKIFFRKEAK